MTLPALLISLYPFKHLVFYVALPTLRVQSNKQPQTDKLFSGSFSLSFFLILSPSTTLCPSALLSLCDFSSHYMFFVSLCLSVSVTTAILLINSSTSSTLQLKKTGRKGGGDEESRLLIPSNASRETERE